MTPESPVQATPPGAAPDPSPAAAPAAAVESAQPLPRTLGLPLPGVSLEDLTGCLIVIEGTDGSGRSTQILFLTEWLEAEGFAVQTMGLRQSLLASENIDQLLTSNMTTRSTLALMYATDFYDQLEHRIVPALRSGAVVLADRYIYTLIARGAVRGLARDYLYGIYRMGLRPDLTFWLNIGPEVAFEREFKKSKAISYWEAGLDISMNSNLYDSFIHYQRKLRGEFQELSQRHGFIEINGEGSVAAVNRELRHRLAAHLGIKVTRYAPSGALSHLWR